MNADQALQEVKYLRREWPAHRFAIGERDRQIVIRVTHPDGSVTTATTGLAAQVQARATRTTNHEGDS
jgi:hypothetical protein